jgi:predicted flap endonuclease-1-like 5' DNA nuclease
MDMTTTLILIILLAAAVIIAVFSLRSKRGGDPAPQARPAVPEAVAATPPLAPEPTPLADEPIVAAAPLDATPASIAADVAPAPLVSTPPAPAAAALTRLKGLGPKLATTLAGLGFTTVDQIAALTPAEAEALDAQLGTFKGRMARDRWIDQAKLLSAGDTAGYEAEFGKLGG